MLDIEAADKGLLIPRIDYNNRPTTGLTEGLLIYVTANGPSGNGFYYYNGTQWVPLLANGNTSGAGSNASCTGGNAQDSWNGSYGQSESIFSIAGVSGTWVRFRFVGMEDGATSTGDFQLYGMSLKGQFPTYGGAMAAGNIYAENNVYAGSNVLQGDVAEYFPVQDETEAGDLISIDPENPDSYRVSAQQNDPHLFGVHSTAPTVTLNNPNSGAPVALQGRVPVKVTAENGNIQPGDPLTASSKKGYAMKATTSCRIIGKALESLKEENGKVLCLLTPSWYQHDSQSAARQSNGQFKILSGNQEVLVNDPAMQSNSKVFISMLDNPGSQYWITSKKRGAFKVALASPSSKAIKFDYLIDNATSVERPATTKQAPEKKEDDENTVVADQTSSLPKEKGENPPAEVPDPSKIYSWSTESGLEELGEPPTKED